MLTLILSTYFTVLLFCVHHRTEAVVKELESFTIAIAPLACTTQVKL